MRARPNSTACGLIAAQRILIAPAAVSALDGAVTARIDRALDTPGQAAHRRVSVRVTQAAGGNAHDFVTVAVHKRHLHSLLAAFGATLAGILPLSTSPQVTIARNRPAGGAPGPFGHRSAGSMALVFTLIGIKVVKRGGVTIGISVIKNITCAASRVGWIAALPHGGPTFPAVGTIAGHPDGLVVQAAPDDRGASNARAHSAGDRAYLPGGMTFANSRQGLLPSGRGLARADITQPVRPSPRKGTTSSAEDDPERVPSAGDAVALPRHHTEHERLFGALALRMCDTSGDLGFGRALEATHAAPKAVLKCPLVAPVAIDGGTLPGNRPPHHPLLGHRGKGGHGSGNGADGESGTATIRLQLRYLRRRGALMEQDCDLGRHVSLVVPNGMASLLPLRHARPGPVRFNLGDRDVPSTWLCPRVAHDAGVPAGRQHGGIEGPLKVTHRIGAVGRHLSLAAEVLVGNSQPYVLGRLRGLRQRAPERDKNARLHLPSYGPDHDRRGGPAELGEQLRRAGAVNVELAREVHRPLAQDFPPSFGLNTGGVGDEGGPRKLPLSACPLGRPLLQGSERATPQAVVVHLIAAWVDEHLRVEGGGGAAIRRLGGALPLG